MAGIFRRHGKGTVAWQSNCEYAQNRKALSANRKVVRELPPNAGPLMKDCRKKAQGGPLDGGIFERNDRGHDEFNQ
jgi:hypothetical protein